MNSLETQVLRLIGESTASPDVFGELTDSFQQIRGSLNDAIQELNMATGAYRRTYFLPIYSGQQLYRLATVVDYIGYVVQAWDRARKYRLMRTDLMALSRFDPWWMKLSGPMTQYFQAGLNVVGVYRLPSENTVLELDCVMIPSPYTAGTDAIKLRAQYQRAAVHYAVSEFYASRGDANRANEYFTRYLETANLMMLRPGMAERQYYIGSVDKPGATEAAAK
jgi:hypothetical protein